MRRIDTLKPSQILSFYSIIQDNCKKLTESIERLFADCLQGVREHRFRIATGNTSRIRNHI